MNLPGFLALGDSYTIGEGVDESERWPVQLARVLREAGTPVGEPRIVARTGWTTTELTAAIADARITETFALVSLLIGVNDQFRGHSAADYRGRFRSLVSRAAAFAGDRPANVIALSIPDWGVMPFAEGRDRARIARDIDEFNAVAKAETSDAGAHWVDVTPTSRAVRPGWGAADGLHPSGAQYAVWAALALEPAKTVLRGSAPSYL